jgi:hypothetical protein
LTRRQNNTSAILLEVALPSFLENDFQAAAIIELSEGRGPDYPVTAGDQLANADITHLSVFEFADERFVAERFRAQPPEYLANQLTPQVQPVAGCCILRRH